MAYPKDRERRHRAHLILLYALKGPVPLHSLMWATTLTLHMLGMMVEGERFLQKYCLCTHNSCNQCGWCGNYCLADLEWQETCTELIPQLQRHPTSTAHLLKASLCVSARSPLNAVTGLLKPVSGGCTGQWSCCEMPAPLENKQTNRKPCLNRQKN